MAAKMATAKYGDRCVVVYCDTLSSEHPDNRRFFADVERWIERPITVIRSAQYKDIDDVFVKARYMAGIAGARCTTELKKLPRLVWQQLSDTHIFGYTVEERKRAATFENSNPELDVEWILIDHGVTKQHCKDALAEAGIALPAMYDLGFDHNNCIGCVKSTSTGYWNRVRKLFPETFARRARQSRLIGARLVRVNGQRVFLDELPPDSYEPDDDIDCGPVCQTPSPVDSGSPGHFIERGEHRRKEEK
jgi:hypothetical protein